MSLDPRNTYTRHAALAELPPLVREQRKHAKKIAAVHPHVLEEKRVRGRIYALLELAGIQAGDGVTCSGYDVVHRSRKGNTSYDVGLLAQIMVDKLVELGMPRADVGNPELAAAGLYVEGAETFVVNAIAAVKSVGDTSHWAEVEPMKGSTVRA